MLVKKIAENHRLPYYTLSPTYSVCKDHGYIIGEHFNCPICGGEAEVYSRITGYYRPVRNWNAGKTQEYKERKEYVVTEEAIENAGKKCACKCEEKKEEPKTDLADGSYLFASPTCPNCKIAYALLEKAGYAYTKLMATENVELTNALGIKQAPTLVVVTNGEVEKFAGVGEIKKAIE